MSEKPKNQENAKNQKNTKNTKTRKHTSNNQGCGITSNVWDLVSCVLSIVECFILKGKSKSESFQKNKSGSRGWTCLVLSKALHLCVFGWHHKSSKIRIFRFAGTLQRERLAQLWQPGWPPRTPKKDAPWEYPFFAEKLHFTKQNWDFTTKKITPGCFVLVGSPEKMVWVFAPETKNFAIT